MGDIALKVDKLSKAFERPGDKGRESFYALKDVSFELYKGEILGVIGSNGSGKSTLLKILSSIYPPDSGNAEYSGRMASIIEIGTGFHPELTGRENIYLGGRLMGLTNKEIDSVYDEIVDFSGIEEFIESPVKHYSSGMYLRLAFSVAFAGNVDVLLLDEVIAVGDEDFRKKCYARILKCKQQGVAIILVSHNLNQVQEFCDRCMYIDGGEIKLLDSTDIVVDYYVRTVHKADEGNEHGFRRRDLGCGISINNVEVYTDNKQLISVQSGINIRVEFDLETDTTSTEIIVQINTLTGNRLIVDSYAFREEYNLNTLPKGGYQAICNIPPFILNKGSYSIDLMIGKGKELIAECKNVVVFNISPDGLSQFEKSINSLLRMRLNWKLKSMNTGNEIEIFSEK